MDEVSTMDQFNMQLFPNPATDKITLTGDIEQADVFQIKVFSSFGTLVAEEEVTLPSGKFNHEIEICEFVHGVYYVSCKGQHYGQVIPFIKRE